MNPEFDFYLSCLLESKALLEFQRPVLTFDGTEVVDSVCLGVWEKGWMVLIEVFVEDLAEEVDLVVWY